MKGSASMRLGISMISSQGTIHQSWAHRSLKSLFELLRSLLLKSLKSGPLRAQFCQFAQSAPLFALRSAIALKMKVRSRAKSERAISKSDVPSLLFSQISTYFAYLNEFFFLQLNQNHWLRLVFTKWVCFWMHNFFAF